MTNKTLEEQETIIIFDRAGDNARIYTADKTMITKLDKKYKREKEYRDKGELYAIEYEIDKVLLSFRTKKVKRTLTAEQKEQQSQRMKAWHKKHNTGTHKV